MPTQETIDQQAQLWCLAMKQKKNALESLLAAQKILEDLQEVFVQHLSSEMMEDAHVRFLSGINPTTSPEAHYLLTIGHMNIRPFVSPYRYLSRSPAAN